MLSSGFPTVLCPSQLSPHEVIIAPVFSEQKWPCVAMPVFYIMVSYHHQSKMLMTLSTLESSLTYKQVEP